MNEPADRPKSIREQAADLGVSYARLRSVTDRGLPAEMVSTMPRYGRITTLEPGVPGSWTWWSLTWEQDRWARDFVFENPDGATLEQVSDMLGTTRERIRQIETRALEKLKEAFADEGLDVDVVEVLRAWGAEHGQSKLGYDL